MYTKQINKVGSHIIARDAAPQQRQPIICELLELREGGIGEIGIGTYACMRVMVLRGERLYNAIPARLFRKK